MPLVIVEDIDPRTTGTYEPDRVPQGFHAPDTYGRMRPNEFSGAKIGGGYDAPQGTPTWEPSWDQNAGITHQDLGGYEVMPAGGSKWSPRYWWQGLRDREHGTNLAQEYLMGEEGMARANREYNNFQIRANEPDARDQRLWMYNQARDENKQPMFFDTIPGAPYGNWMHRMQYTDVPETIEASVDPDDWRTIIKILEAGGDPDDYVTKVDYDEEEPVEKEGGIFSNRLMDKYRRQRRKETRRDPFNDLLFKRMMEDKKFNTSPGTGDINPIFGDPYWNI